MLTNPDAIIDQVYRSDWGRILASLIRLVNDFDLAEEALQEAFAAALVQWRSGGVPESPQAWIFQTARHKAIDRIRRRSRFTEKLESYAAAGLIPTSEPSDHETNEIADDRLRLIFTCCHPALASESQVALTLRTLGGLETDGSPAHFWCRRRRWLSALFVPNARSATPASPTRCPTCTRCRPGSTLC